jgi:hypothetical protein
MAMALTLNITSPTALKAQPGTVFSFAVLVAGAAGTINDCTTTGAAAAANAICAMPAAVTAGFVQVGVNTTLGIVVTPGAAQVVAVSWQ